MGTKAQSVRGATVLTLRRLSIAASQSRARTGFVTCQGERTRLSASMAIFGSIATVREQLGNSPQFKAAFAYLEDCFHPGSAASLRLQQIAEGKSERVELAGGAFALEQVYRSKPRADGFFESHRAFIDVQVVVSGEEFIEVNDIAGLQVKEDRTPGKDVIIYHMTDTASALRMRAGDAAVLYPVDGHMPSVAIAGSALVRKIVVKVPVA